MKTLKTIKKEIESEQYYSPMKIAQNRWIVSGGIGKSSYYYVLKLIKCNRLRAVDLGLGMTKYYRVLGSDILRFVKNFYGRS